MRSVQSSVVLATYQQELVNVLRSHDCLVFLDTNLLAWGFRLNEAACGEFIRWIEDLAQHERLVIPAWTVHEYNHLLLRDPTFFLPHKTLAKQLNSTLAEFDRVSHLMFSDASATQLGYSNRDALLSAFSEASKTIQRCVAHLPKTEARRRENLVTYLETLIAKCALKSDVHELAATAARETPARYAHRLSPGGNDAQKSENSGGDFIIWKELLSHCEAKGAKEAVLITNDRKPDWVYAPLTVVLPNGSVISGTNESARHVRLANPDLLAEFEHHTGSTDLHIFSIESVIEALSSTELNPGSAQEFRDLALAIKLDLARTPTGAVVQWFLAHPDKYTEAVHGVCYWEHSPSEVDQEEFKTWTVKEMTNVDGEKVNWTLVFCELFL